MPCWPATSCWRQWPRHSAGPWPCHPAIPSDLPGRSGTHRRRRPAVDWGPRSRQGTSGNPGLQGQPGQNGQNGSEGPAGPQGPQGLQGPQGVPGTCVECPCECKIEFAEVYSSISQMLAPSDGPNLPGTVVILENTIYSTSNIDTSLAAITGQVTINVAGWYDITVGVTGGLNPIPSPLPVWTVSLFKNGVIVPGSTFANMTISPEQQANEEVTDVFVHCNVGDVLTIANTSTANLQLSSPSLGTNAVPNSATLKIMLLKAD